MKRISTVLLVYLATVTHQGLAETTREQAPVNQYKNPVMQQQQRIVYQQQEWQHQQIQPTGAGTEKAAPQLTAAVSALTTTTQTTSLNKALEIFGLGIGIGVKGLLSGDYNNDGITELVFGNPGAVVFGQAQNGKFTLQNQLQFANGISDLEYFRDLSSDGHYAFFISDQKLQKLDLITRRVVATLDVGYISSFRLLHQPSSVLLLRSQNGSLNVVDPVTLKLLQSHAGAHADIAAVGSFTLKNKSQILLADGKIFNFNSNSDITLETTVMFNEHSHSHPIDVNKDGLDEILFAEGWYSIKLFSPLTNETLWSKKTSHNIDALILADVDVDGKPEGVYGDGQWGMLHAFDLQTGENFWSMANPEHGVTGIVIADLDNDGKQDIGWGSGYSSSGADLFFIHDFVSKELKWKSDDIHFPIAAVALADIDQDGDLDALAASVESDSGYSGGVIQTFDIQRNTRLWQALAANNWGHTMHINTADLDNDGKTELIIGSSEIYTGLVRVMDASNGEERFKKLLGSGDNISSLLVADLDNDGYSEIIVANGAEHTGSEGVYFTVLDGRTGDLKKKSPNLDFSWQGLLDLTTVDVNGRTLVYGLFNQNLYQYDYSNNTLKKLTTTGNYRQLTKVVIAGVTELAVTNAQGDLIRMSIAGIELASTKICNNSDVVGLTRSGPDRVLFSCQNSFSEYNWLNNSVSFTQQTGFKMAGDPQQVRHKDQDYIIVGGDKVAVYTAQAQVALPKPDPLKLTTHVLKSVKGTMSIFAEVDYFVLGSSSKSGQLSFTNRQTGQFVYQPAGKEGTETLKYYAVKGQAMSPEAELIIELTNAKPVAEHLNISTHWSKTVQLTLIAKDDDQEVLQYALTSQPKHGQLKLQDQAKGTVEYVPSGESLETVSFSFNAKDSLHTSDQKNVVITLTNTAPVAVAKSYNTSYQTPVHGALQGQDADNDVISYELTSQPSAGSLTLDSKNGLFVYTPAGDTDQSISFGFIVKDKFASSTVQTVSISVQGAPKKSSGGALNWASVVVLLLFVIRRRSSQ